MLSAETSVGKYPVEAVEFMARIAAEDGSSMRTRGFQEFQRRPEAELSRRSWPTPPITRRGTPASRRSWFSRRAGRAPGLISRYRPPDPIYAFTPNETVARQLSIHYGVSPILAPDVGSTDEMMAQMDALLRERGSLKSATA